MREMRIMPWIRDSVGFWGWYSLSYWVSTQAFSKAGDLWWLNQFGFCGLACIVIALLFVAVKLHSLPIRALDICMHLVGFCALICLQLTQAGASGSTLLVLGVIAFGAFVAWSVCRWGSYYATLTAKDTLVLVLFGVLITSLIKLMNAFIPSEMALAILCGILLFMALSLRKKPMIMELWKGVDEPYTMQTILSLWQTLLSIVIFFMLWSFLNLLFNINIGHIAINSSATGWLILWSQAIDIGFSLFMLWWVLKRRQTIDWTLFWQTGYFLLALGLLAMALFGSVQVVQVFLSAAAELVFMFMLYFLIHLGRCSVYKPPVVIAAGYALISLLDWSARAFVAFNAIGFDDAPIVPIFLFIILFTIVFFLPARSPGMQFLTTELVDTSSRPGNLERHHPEELAEKYALSAREIEVVMLLSKGRSAPYIAETLYLSENTVKTYTKRIYQKLDVHNKQELINLIKPE